MYWPKGASTFSKRFLEVLEAENLPLDAVEVLAELRGHLLALEDRLAKCDRMIMRMLKDEMVTRLMAIPGVGPVVTTASADAEHSPMAPFDVRPK
ncbi:hypothetical protein HMI48_13670 [Acidithiobacillus ferrooxidans]|uniref:hypothetical protein n=1 Tax=Acidithiobacillus ferrooxidans TaxID=920 RepID=UPI001C0737FA|nr:hypothetical protein [Acidithiobacillus ferrooxidans]MBU2774870.1 hypothetical protein [Acidithiobacillus ferrooxidans]